MKRVKNMLLTGLLVTVPAFSGFSQLYIGLGTGYGFGLANMTISDNVVNNSGSTAYTSNKTSLGQGIPLMLNVGYQIKQHVAFEMNFSYLLGTKDVSTYNDYAGTFQEETHEIKARMLRVVPTIRFSFGEGKIRPYMRYGLSVGLMGKMISTLNETDNFSGATIFTYSVEEYKGGISLGLNSAMGAYFALSDKLLFFAEINAFVQSWAPKRSEFTTYEVNNVNQLVFMSTYQKETEYVKEHTEFWAPQNQSESDKSTKFYLPMSSIGLQVGISLTLGK